MSVTLDLGAICDVVTQNSIGDVTTLTVMTDIVSDIVITRKLFGDPEPVYQVRVDEHEIRELSPDGDARFVDDTQTLCLVPFADLELPVEWR